MKRRHVVKSALTLTTICCVTLLRAAVAANAELLTAIRNDDASTLRALLLSGADPNTRDDLGASALMHAAAFSSFDNFRAVLDSGADVN